jgi:hypothetical protein
MTDFQDVWRVMPFIRFVPFILQRVPFNPRTVDLVPFIRKRVPFNLRSGFQTDRLLA